MTYCVMPIPGTLLNRPDDVIKMEAHGLQGATGRNRSCQLTSMAVYNVHTTGCSHTCAGAGCKTVETHTQKRIHCGKAVSLKVMQRAHTKEHNRVS